MSWELFQYQGESIMIKECPVIMNNEAVTVVRFNGIDIQFPSVGQENIKFLNVKFENGKYSITDDKEEINSDVKESVDTEQNNNDKNKKTIKKKHETIVE